MLLSHRVDGWLRSGVGVLGWDDEFAFPAGDDGGGEAIADEIDCGACHVHEFVDADDEDDAFEREAEGDEGAGEDDLGGAGDAGHAFAGEHEGEHDGDLLADAEFDASGLGDEDGGNGEVEGGAVEIEGVAHGHDKGDDALGDAEGDEALHGVGEGGVGGGGGEGEDGGFANGVDEAFDGDARPESDGEEDDEAEDDESSVEGEDEFAEVEEDAEAAVTDGIGHGGADAKGGEFHDEADKLEHDLGEGFAEAEHGGAVAALGLGEGDGEQDREADDLKDIIGGGCLKKAARDGMFDDAG